MGFIQGRGSLYALRLLLGLFEGCLFPSMILFLGELVQKRGTGSQSFVLVLYVHSKAELRANGWTLGPGEVWTDRVPEYRDQF